VNNSARMGPGEPRLFRSFWMAGYECSCHINSRGVRLDMIAALQHDVRATQDYALLRSVDIRTARDGIRWHCVDRCGEYDFSSWQPMLDAARTEGIQVIWDLCHYGWPDDLDIFSPAFVDRFARFCRAVAQFHKNATEEIPFFTPINEISFFSWAACRRLMFPYAYGGDNELKRQLIRAAIAGVAEIRTVDSRARIVFAEPLIHNVPPRAHPELTEPAKAQRASQFEAWDMLAGRLCPELGGDPRYLDVIGVNFYAANEWEVPGGKKLAWDGGPQDSRWRGLHLLLAEVYERYQRPLFIAETSHYGIGRAPWIREIAQETCLTRQAGVPLEGICLYPILDRFDWDNPRHWHNSGLWDFTDGPKGDYTRVLNQEYAHALWESQQLLAPSTVGKL
jgi:hypothetical protein